MCISKYKLNRKRERGPLTKHIKDQFNNAIDNRSSFKCMEMDLSRQFALHNSLQHLNKSIYLLFYESRELQDVFLIKDIRE